MMPRYGPGPAPARSRDIAVLIAFVALCLAVSAIGGSITATSVGTWYQTLDKPSFNPPDWVFAPVWTVLYVLMAVAVWRVWRGRGIGATRTALFVFALQLVLNSAWSLLFFGFRRIDLALIDVVALLLAIIANIYLFWRLDRVAGALLVPYALWVAYAAVLNGSLLLLNATWR